MEQDPDSNDMEKARTEEKGMSEQAKATYSRMTEESTYEEEAAEEMAVDSLQQERMDEEIEDVSNTDVTSVTGWIALALSVLSLFMMPIILGGAGIIVGFAAKSRGAEIMGNTAIITGAVSIIIRLFVLPFV